MKILLLPLFKMESGHHRTSDALVEAFIKQDPYVQCEKVEFLSYVNAGLEKFISNLYLNWITQIPSLYSLFYKKFFYKKSSVLQSIYLSFFLEKMEQMIQQKQPDLIICTHSFPSFLVHKLKEYGVIKVMTGNVYTDFFINDLWGKKHIDLHFVPSKEIKEQLIKASVPEENIIISGMVTDDIFLKKKNIKVGNKKFHILVSGGNQGYGKSLAFLREKRASNLIEYRVLCGMNQELYEELVSLQSESIKPLTYIKSTEQMNHLYNWADALITKPGGITISEAIKKRIPIFIHTVIPGQEEMNMSFLVRRNLVHKLKNEEPIEDQIISVLKNPASLFEIKKAMHHYINDVEIKSCEEVASSIINKMINQTLNEHVRFIDQVFSRIYSNL
ncbi:MGDG synthase family glycosyltransferase [Niallia sp. Krafla_26]|uniref:MGDG synthase family glycosyltransferase n=1 Tax=Niallia sp. Krafla_26 TaxID=3064703 RepID=UPI003D162532